MHRPEESWRYVTALAVSVGLRPQAQASVDAVLISEFSPPASKTKIQVPPPPPAPSKKNRSVAHNRGRNLSYTECGRWSVLMLLVNVLAVAPSHQEIRLCVRGVSCHSTRTQSRPLFPFCVYIGSRISPLKPERAWIYSWLLLGLVKASKQPQESQRMVEVI